MAREGAVRLLGLAGLLVLLALLLTLRSWRTPARRGTDRHVERAVTAYVWVIALGVLAWWWRSA